MASASQRAKMRGQHVRAGQDLHAAPRTLLPSGRISQPSARRSASAVLPHAAAAPWPSQRTGAYRGVTQRDPESETQRQRGQGGARAWGLSSCQGGGLREALRRDQIYEAETAPPAATIIGIAFFAAIVCASECAVCSRETAPVLSLLAGRDRLNENSRCSAGCSVGLERLLQLLWASRTLSPRRGRPLCRAVSHGGNWAA